MAEFMFPNVAYRATLYRTGIERNETKVILKNFKKTSRLRKRFLKLHTELDILDLKILLNETS